MNNNNREGKKIAKTKTSSTPTTQNVRLTKVQIARLTQIKENKRETYSDIIDKLLWFYESQQIKKAVSGASA